MRRAPAVGAARRPARQRSHCPLRRRPRPLAAGAGRVLRDPPGDAARGRGEGAGADPGLPPHRPACLHSRADFREGRDPGERPAGGHVPRAAVLCALPAGSAGHQPLRPHQLHLPRRLQAAGRRAAAHSRAGGGRGGRAGAPAQSAGGVHRRTGGEGVEGVAGPAHRTQQRDRPHHPCAVPAPQEQSHLRGRPGRGQDRHRRRARPPDP